MQDRLVALLRWFELRAGVFQAGKLPRAARFDAADGLGYMHVLRAGAMRVDTAGHPPIEVAEPSLVLYMTPTSHALQPHGPDTDTVCASFEFGAGLRNPLVRALPDVVVIELAELPALHGTLEVLFREAMEQHCGRQAILDRMCEVLIIQVLRELMDQQRIEIGLLAGLSDPRLAQAINAMHAEPSRSWSLEALAALANLSRARFATRFRETVGTTPMAHLAEWRLSVAQSLLRRGVSVQQAADETGFSSASALSRAFTAHTGCSPRTWRRQHADAAA